MIEAVASFQDSGSTRIIGLVNRLAALTIPHNTFALKGYGDKKSQQMFANAHAFAKVLLVKKSMYDRNTFYTTTFESQT